MASKAPNLPTNDEDDAVNVEDIEQLCNRMSKYDPSFRISLLHYHLKRLGISCNDERMIKLLSLSFETMIRSIVADCSRINKDHNLPSKTLTSDLLSQVLLNKAIENENQTETNQESTNNTFDVNDFFNF